MAIAARLKFLIALTAGAALPLAYAPFGLFAIAPICLAVLMSIWADARPTQAFLLGLTFGTASFLVGMYWIYISIHDFGGAHALLAGLLTAALVAVLGLFPALVGWIAARWFTLRGGFAWLGVVPALWVLAEWCRGWVFSGMGWLAAGYSQADSWLIGYAPLGGVYLVSWMVLLCAGALVTIARTAGRPRKAALIVIVAVWLVAYFLADHRWTHPNSDVLTVALAQGAVSQDLKWQRAQLVPTLDLYRSLTEQAASSDLVIWPEAAVPAVYDSIAGYLDEIRAIAAETGGHVLLGVLREDPASGAIQNALVSLDDRPSYYIKRHLVPYGEYFPVPGFVRDWMRLLDLPYSDISPGPPNQPPLTVAGQKLAITICYEDVFGAEQLHYMPEATLLVNVSNDAWFGDSVAPHQHLDIARFRAAEVGRYLLRATNTGITAIVDPGGRIVSRSPQFEPHLLKGAVQGFIGSTPYARWGNYAVVLLAALTLIVARAMSRGRS